MASDKSGFHRWPYGGSFEVFHATARAMARAATARIGGETHDVIDEGKLQPGWYWWACHPGCLPDSDEPWGPFPTSEAAWQDAMGDDEKPPHDLSCGCVSDGSKVCEDHGRGGS